jgi:hypothetical protein
MPDVYRSGEVIPELDGSIHGGVTVVLHRIDEVRGLLALCALAGRPPEDPLAAIYQALSRETLDLSMWQAWQSKLAITLPPWQQSQPEAVSAWQPMTDWKSMTVALSMAGELWERQETAVNGLCLAVTVADPATDAEGKLEIGGATPGLVLHKGSIWATLRQGTVSVAKYAVSLLPARGILPSQRTGRLVEDLRTRARAKSSRPDFERLDKLTDKDLKRRHSAIVFVHGLLSTDVRVFDALIDRLLKEYPAFTDGYILTGWPHDTLTSIETNGDELAAEIMRLARGGVRSFAFVCHSRGGLVARSAAEKIYRKGPKWRQHLRGCLTFGTPHQGAALAELPEKLLGALTVLQAFRSADGFASAADMLNLPRPIKGIEDLRPPRGGGTFLEELRRNESAQAGEYEERLLSIFAIGGNVNKRDTLGQVVANYAHGGAPNDLIVETASSIPHLFRAVPPTDCDHFSYFSKEECAKQSVTDGIAFLHTVLRRRSAQDADSATRAATN